MKKAACYLLRKIIVFVLAAMLIQPVSAQNCPNITSWNLVTVSNDGLGNCTYRVDFTQTVNGSNKSVQVVVSCNGSPALNECIPVNSSSTGTISTNTFACSCSSSKSLIFNSFTNGSCGGASCTTTGNLLPVSILSFTIRAVNNVKCLSWIMGEQGSVQDYIIEYSSNGTDFTVAGSVAPTNIGIQSGYNFCDPVSRDNGFYRIKIIELNGGIRYSTVLKFAGKNENGLNIFPNPATNKLNMVMPASGFLNNAAYVIYSGDGQSISAGKLSNSFIDISNLPKGIYYLRVKNETKILLEKTFIKN